MCYCGYPSANVVFEGGTCGDGKGMDIEGECVDCALSSFRSGTDYERISCQTCHDATGDAHRTTTQVGSVSVDACVCNRGYYEDSTSTSTCVKCPVNTFKSVASNEQSQCTPCAEGLLSRAGSTAEEDCSPPYSVGGYTAEVSVQKLLGIISHQTRVQDAWIDPRPHQQNQNKRCMFSDDGLTVDCPGESFTVFPRAVLPSTIDNTVRLTEFSAADEILGLSKFIGQGIDTRFRVAMNPSAGNQLIHDTFFDLEPLKDTPRYLSLPVRRSYGGPHFAGFYEQILSGSQRWSPGAKLNYKLRLDAVDIDLSQTEVSLVTFITNKRLESQTDFQWIVCADTTNGLSICQDNVPDPDDASKTMYKNAAVLDATVFRLSSTKSCYGDVFWLYNCEEQAAESPTKSRFDDVFEWVPFGTTQPDLLPASTDFFLYTTFFVGQAAQCVDHGCIESSFYAQMSSHLSETLTSSSIAELRFLPGTEITIQTVPESLTYEDIYPTSAGLLAAEKYTHPIPLEGAMHIKYKNIDETTTDQLCEFDSAGTGVVCRNESTPNVFAKNMLTDGSLGKIEADFAAILPVKICCDQEVDATCETELAVCHDGVDSQTSTHSLKEDITIFEDLNVGTAPYLDVLNACGVNKDETCSCSANQQPVASSKDRQVYERGSGVFSCAPESCKKAKKWRISNAGDMGWVPIIGGIMLYQDKDCTIEYDLTDVTKSTSIPARNGYPFSYAFDGITTTHFRPNWAPSAFEWKITFEFEHEVQVMCVKTTANTGGSAHIQLGLGYSSGGNNAAQKWNHGILLEASCDGSKWFSAAGPDLYSNNVVADKAPEDDSVCTDERGLQLKPGGALNFEIFNAVPDVEISTQTNLAFVKFVQTHFGFPDTPCNTTRIQTEACKIAKESALPDYVFRLTADVYRTFTTQGNDFETKRSESYDVLMRLRQNSGETFLQEILADYTIAGKRFFDTTNDGCGVTDPCLGAASGLIVTGETAPYVFLYKTKSIQHATSCDCKTRDTLPVTLLNNAPTALLDAKDLSACLATNTCQEVCPAGECSVLEFDATSPAPLSSVVFTALHDKDNLVVSYSDDGTTYEHYSTVSLPDTRTNEKDGAFVYSALAGENITNCDNIGSGCGYHTYADAQAFAENTLRVDWVASTTSQTCEQACVAAGGSCVENLLAQVDTKDETIAAIGQSSLSSQVAGANYVAPTTYDYTVQNYHHYNGLSPNEFSGWQYPQFVEQDLMIAWDYDTRGLILVDMALLGEPGYKTDVPGTYFDSTGITGSCVNEDRSVFYYFGYGRLFKVTKPAEGWRAGTPTWADVSGVEIDSLTVTGCHVSNLEPNILFVSSGNYYIYKYDITTKTREFLDVRTEGQTNAFVMTKDEKIVYFWKWKSSDYMELWGYDVDASASYRLAYTKILRTDNEVQHAPFLNEDETKLYLFASHNMFVLDISGWRDNPQTPINSYGEGLGSPVAGKTTPCTSFSPAANWNSDLQKYEVDPVIGTDACFPSYTTGGVRSLDGLYYWVFAGALNNAVLVSINIEHPPPPVVGTNVVPACVDGKGLISFDSLTTVFTFNNCTQSAEEAGYWRASSLSGSNQPVSNAGRQCHLSESTEKICPCKITQTYDDTLVAKRLASAEEIKSRLASQPTSDFVATRNTWAPAQEKDYVCVSLHGCEVDGETYKPGTLATKAYKPNTPPAGAHKKFRFLPGHTLSSDAKVFTVELFSDSFCLNAIDLSTGVEMNSLSISGDTSTVTPQSMLVDINTPIAIPDGASFQIEVTFSDAVVLGCSRVVGLGVQNDVSNVNRHRGGVRVEYWDDVAATYKLYAAAVPFSDETPLAAPGYTGNVQMYPLTGLYNTNFQLLSVDLPKHRYWKLALNTEAPVFEANLCSTPGCTSEFNKKDAGLCPADPDTCYGTQPEDFSCDSTMKQELQTSPMVDGLNLKFVEAGSTGCAKATFFGPPIFSHASLLFNPTAQQEVFSGSADDTVTFPNSFMKFNSNGGLSLITKFKFTSLSSAEQNIIFVGGTGFIIFLQYDYNQNKISMQVQYDSITCHVYHDSSPVANTEYEAIVSLQLQNSKIKFILNGIEQSDSCQSGFTLPDRDTLIKVVGTGHWSRTNAYFSGVLHGAYFFDRPLSSDEAADVASAIKVGGLENDAFVCHACPLDQTTPFDGATKPEQCQCRQGFFSSDSSGCTACGSGMTTEIVGAQSEAACGCLKGSYFQKAFKYESLTAWYKFEKDAQDYGPNGVHLQPRLDATPSFSPDGHIIANDDISYLLPTPQTVIPNGTTTLTVSFWVKNWVDGYIMHWVPTEQFEESVENSVLKHLLATNTTWSFIVAVFDTTGTTLYKGGVKIANSSTAKIPAEGFEQEFGSVVGIFCDPNSESSAHDFQGEFKDLRFYTAAFTAEEVGQLYQDSPRCVSCGTGLTTAGFGATSASECNVCEEGLYMGIKPPEVIKEGFTVVNADKDLAVGYTRHVAAQGAPYSGEFGYDADGIGKNAYFTGIEAVSWIPNTKKVLIPDTSKNKVKYMDLETYEVTTFATLTSSTHGTIRRACAVDDKKFYLATSKGILEYDVNTDSLSFIYTEGSGINTYGCAISQNGWLAFSQFQTVWELELANPTNVRSLGPATDADSYGRTGKVYYMTYSPDDEYLVFTENQWSQVRKVHRTTLVNSAIAGVQYSNSENNADGKAFTSYFLYPKGLAFSRDGKYLYVAAWNSVKRIDYEGNPDSLSYVSTLTGQTNGLARDLTASYTGSPDQAKFGSLKDLAILGDGYAIGIDYGTKSIYQINLGDDFVVPPTLQYFTEQVCLACSTGITTASAGATSAGQCTVNAQGYTGIPDPVLPGLQAHYFKSDALSDATGGSSLIPSATYNGGYTFGNNYLDVTADTRLDAPPGEIYGNGQSDFSISFWAADVPYDGNRHILRVHVTNVIIRTQMHNSNRVLFYYFKDANGNVCEAFFDLDLSGSEFTFVTVVKKGTDVRVFVDGAEGGSGNYADKLSACTAALAPGDDATLLSHGDSALQFFRGKIKDMRIFDRAISTDEIKRMFTASGNPLTKCPPLQTTEYTGAQTCGCDVGLYLPAPSTEPSVTYPNPDAYGYARTVAGVDGVKGNVDGDGSDPALTKLEHPQHLATLAGTKDLVIMEREANNLKILDMKTNAVTTLFHFPDLAIRAICTDESGEFIFMVFTTEIKQYDVANNVSTTLVSVEQMGAGIVEARGCAVSKDGYLSTTLLWVIDGAFVRKLWEVEIENPTNVVVHGFEFVSNDLAYSPDDRYIYFGHTNHIAKLSRATSETVVVAGQPGVYGQADGSLADSLVASPSAIIFEGTGRYIYFSDFRTIRRIDLTVPTSDPNYVSTLFGSFDSSQNIDGAQPEFWYLNGLALAPNDAYFYVSTDSKATVRRVSLGRDLVIGPPAPTCTACPAGMTSDFGSTSHLQCFTPIIRAPSMHSTYTELLPAPHNASFIRYDLGSVKNIESVNILLRGRGEKHGVQRQVSSWNTLKVKYSAVSDDFDQAYVCATYDPDHDDAVFHSAETNLLKKSCLVKAQYIFVSVDSGTLSYDEVQIVPSKYQFGPTAKYTWSQNAANTNFITLWSNLSGTTSWIEGKGERKDPFFYSLDEHFNYEYFDGQNELFSWPEGYLIGGLTWKQHLAAGDRKPMFPSTAAALQPLVATFPSKTAYFQIELPFANVISEILVQPGPRYAEWKAVWGYAWPGRVKVFTSFADDFDVGADSTAVLAHEGDIDYGTRDARGIPRDDTFEVVFTNGPKRGRFVRMVFERCTESLCVNNPDEEIQFHEILQFRAGLKPCVHKCQGCCADGALIGADSFPSLNLGSLSQGQTTTANLYLASATDCQHTNSDGQATMRPCPEGRECKTDAYTLDYADGRYQLSGTSNKTPTLQVRKGKPSAITFPSGHPLVISENSEWGAAALSQDVVTAGSVATITLPAASTKTVLYYYCSLHLGMGVGKIEILESDGARGTSACAIDAEQDFAPTQTEFVIGPIDTSSVFKRNFDATLPWMRVTDSMPDYDVNNGHLLKTDPASNQMSTAYVDETSAMETGVFLAIDTTRPQVKSGLEPLTRGNMHTTDKKVKTISLSTQAGYMGPGGGTGFVQKIRVDDGWDRVSVELEPHLALKSVWKDNLSNMYPTWTDSRNVKVASFITDKQLESDDDWKWIVCGEKSEQIRNFPTPSFVLDQLTLVGDSPPDSVMENSKTTYKSSDIFESQGGFIKNLPSFADINCDPSQVASTDCRSSYSSTTAALGYAKCDLSSDLSAQENCVFTVKDIIEHHFVNAFNRMKQQDGVEVDKLTLPASSLTRGLIERTPVIANHFDTAPVLLNKGKASVCHTDLLGAQVDTGSGSTARFLPRRDYSIASNPPTAYDQKGSLAYGGFDGMPCSIDTGLADSTAEEAFLTEKTLQEVLDLFNDKQDCVCGMIFTGFASNGTVVKQTFRVERTDVTEGDGHEHSYVTPLSAADAQAGHVLGRAYVQSDKTIRVYESDPATNVYGATTKALPGEYKICQDESDPDSDTGAVDKKNVHVLDGRVISLGKTPRPTYQPGVDGLSEGAYLNSVHWPDDGCSYMKPHLFVHSTIDDDLTWSQVLKSEAVFAPMGVINDLDNSGVFQWMYDENDLDAQKNPSFDNVCEKDVLNHNLPKTVPCKWTPGYGEVHQKLTCGDKDTWSNLLLACPNDNPTLFAGKNFGHKGRCAVLTTLGSYSTNCNEYCALQGKQCSYGWKSNDNTCGTINSNTQGCTATWSTDSSKRQGCDCAGGDLPLATDTDVAEIEFDASVKSGSAFIDKLYVPEKGWHYFLFFQHKDVSDKYYILPMPGNPGPAHVFTPGDMLIGGRGGVGVSAERCPVSDDYFNTKGVLSWKPNIESSASDFYLYHMFLVGESYSCKSHNCIDSKVYDDSAEMTKMRNAKIDPDSNPPLLIMQGSRFALSEVPKVPFVMLDNCLTVALAAPSFSNGQILTKYYYTRTLAGFAQDFGDFDECLGCVSGVCNSGVLPCKYYDSTQSKTFYTMQVYKGDLPAALLTFWLSNSADATTGDEITLEAYAVTHPGKPEQSLSTAETYATGDKLFTTENKRCADGASRRRNLLSWKRASKNTRKVRKQFQNLVKRARGLRRRQQVSVDTEKDTYSISVRDPPKPSRMRKLLTIGSGDDDFKSSTSTRMQREVTSVDGNRVMANTVCGSSGKICELLRVGIEIDDDIYCLPEWQVIDHVNERLSKLRATTVDKWKMQTVSVYRPDILEKCFHSTVYTRRRRLLSESNIAVASANVALSQALNDYTNACTSNNHCVVTLDVADTDIGKKGIHSVHMVTEPNGDVGVRICFGGPECYSRIDIANHTQMSQIPVTVDSDAPSPWAIVAVVAIVILVIIGCFLGKKWYDSSYSYKKAPTTDPDYAGMNQQYVQHQNYYGDGYPREYWDPRSQHYSPPNYMPENYPPQQHQVPGIVWY